MKRILKGFKRTESVAKSRPWVCDRPWAGRRCAERGFERGRDSGSFHGEGKKTRPAFRSNGAARPA